MKALILVGGYGTRLRPLTCTRPKPLLPIANQPLLEWTIRRLTKYHIDEIILAIHYRSEQIQMYFGDGSRLGVKITYSKEDEPLGTGGPIKLAERYLGSEEPFYVLNSDIVCYLDYSKLLEMHKKNQALGTMALHSVEDPSRYGVVELGENNQIKKFVEKPSKEQAPSNMINAGIYVLDPEILDMIPKDRPFSSERELFPRLVTMHRLFGYEVAGVWIDTGKPADYLAANRALLNQEYNRVSVAKDVTIPKSAVINPPVLIAEGCIIGENNQIGPNVSLNNRVRLEDDVIIKDSIIFPKVNIGTQSSIIKTILGEGVTVGKSVNIKGETLIGDFVRVADKITIVSGVTICPGKKISIDILSPQKIM